VKSAEVQYNLSLLFHASRENFPEAVDMLLEKGADPSLVNNKGISVLHLMAKKGQLDMARKCYRKIPWLEVDDFVNQGSESGWTPLMSAAENGQYDFAKWLLSSPNGAEVNKQMKTGWTAMHAAAKKNNEGMVKLLLLHGGDQDIYATHKDFGNGLQVMDVTKDCKVLRLLAQYD
jgi:ankyrin repeat protein